MSGQKFVSTPETNVSVRRRFVFDKLTNLCWHPYWVLGLGIQSSCNCKIFFAQILVIRTRLRLSVYLASIIRSLRCKKLWMQHTEYAMLIPSHPHPEEPCTMSPYAWIFPQCHGTPFEAPVKQEGITKKMDRREQHHMESAMLRPSKSFPIYCSLPEKGASEQLFLQNYLP